MSVGTHFNKYEFQTRLKHKILREYLVPWATILGRNGQPIWYIDGFAGEGTYSDEEMAGSPIIALSIARELREKGIDLRCVFLEEKPKTAKKLEERLESLGFDKTNVYGVFCASFDSAVRRIRKQAKNPPATFVFVDPCGWTGYSMRSIKALMKYPKCEVLINFMYDQLNRFVSSEKHKDFGWCELLGCDLDELEKFQAELRCLSGKPREEKIRNSYTAFLKENGGVKYAFPLAAKYGNKERTYFYLFHCTGSFLGLKIMKDIMWKATEGTYGYIDQELTGEDQLLLSMDGQMTYKENLERFLLAKYALKTATFQQILEENYDLTPLRETDFRKLLQAARKEGRVSVKAVSSVKHGLKEDDEVTFPLLLPDLPN